MLNFDNLETFLLKLMVYGIEYAIVDIMEKI